jgi:hypothetical protein
LLHKKTSTLSKRKYPIVFATFLVFIDAGKNLVMVDDVVRPSNFLISLIEKEEFEEASFDVNVFNGRAKKNHPEEWCAFKSIIRHGIIACFLTHMP